MILSSIFFSLNISIPSLESSSILSLSLSLSLLPNIFLFLSSSFLSLSLSFSFNFSLLLKFLKFRSSSCLVWNGDNKYYINYIEVDYTIPFYAKQDEMYLYFETPSNSGQTGAFRVYELVITDVTPGATVYKPGYSIIDNKYVSNYNKYNVSFNPASATNPLKLNGNYTDDYNADGTVWCKEITLNSGNNWVYQWNKEMLEEKNNRLYQYWIEEPDYDDNSDYIVDISGNHVATNTQDNPIVVSNTYIWYTLPATGGDGSLRFYLAAAVLISISLFSAIALIRRERRSG